jgi:hypothetical protein
MDGKIYTGWWARHYLNPHRGTRTMRERNDQHGAAGVTQQPCHIEFHASARHRSMCVSAS